MRRPVALIALLAFACCAHAIPVLYEIELKTTSGEVKHFDPVTRATTSVSAAGNVYNGFFAVDDEVLASDGLNKMGVLYFFILQIESHIWAYGVPGNNVLEGFRGPTATAAMDGSAMAPGFDVMNGEVVSLRGGVYGPGDASFIDFQPIFQAPHTFWAFGLGVGSGPDSWSWISGGSGSMRISRIPEPSTVLLFGLGIMGSAAFRLRRTATTKDRRA